jgi:peptide/nickel transport system permease protein
VVDRSIEQPVAGSFGLAEDEQRRHNQVRRSVFARRLVANRLGVVGASIVLLMTLAAIFAPFIAPADPIAMNIPGRSQPPSREHLLGTDDFGRDVLSRVIYGGRVSIRVGVLAVTISLVAGSLIGLFAGYAGGWFDHVSQRFIDVMLAFPELILALAIVAVLGSGLTNVMIAIGIGSIPVYARVMRGQVLALRNEQYVEAARAVGVGHLRLIFRHILPNTLSAIVVVATLGIAGAILAGAGLSFIGMGAQPPTPEWGAMLSSGRGYLRHEWWIPIFPGLALAITALGFNLMGDGLRDALDPRSVQRR